VFAEELRDAKRIRSVEELTHVIQESFQKCPPKCEEVWDCVDFDSVMEDIGTGTIGGIQGGRDQLQEEKPIIYIYVYMYIYKNKFIYI
jgi:hypothetical protein